MSNASSCAPAWLIELDPSHKEILPGLALPFKPNQLSLSRSVQWHRKPSPGSNVASLEFGGAGQTTLTVQLFFDTSESGEDVRERYTDAIYRLTFTQKNNKDPKTHKSQPPGVRFRWGAKAWFDGVITNVSHKFTYFKADGKPLRAMLDLTLEQIRDDEYLPPQNPTSVGVGGERVWQARQNDTLVSIATRLYGNPDRWREIADANPLNNRRGLRIGQQVIIPNLQR